MEWIEHDPGTCSPARVVRLLTNHLQQLGCSRVDIWRTTGTACRLELPSQVTSWVRYVERLK